MELKKQHEPNGNEKISTDVLSPNSAAHSKEKRRIIKSLLVLAASIYGVFTAYAALEILQSTLNKETGINSIVILYTTKIVTSFLGLLIVSKLTPKWTIFLSFLCHSCFVLANFYPVWYVLMPAAALVGMATGPLWISINLYLTVLGVQYSNITGTPKATVLSKWNSLVMLTMPIAMISGNFLSSVVLRNVHFGESVDMTDEINGMQAYITTASSLQDQPFHSIVSSANGIYQITSVPLERVSTDNASISAHDYCGPKFCPWMTTEDSGINIKNLKRPNQGAIYLLVGIFALFNLFGVLLALFGLQNLKQDDLDSELAVKHAGLCNYVRHYLKLFFNWHFLLLIPSILYMHLTLSLVNAMFPRAYVSCYLGVGMIGYVSMTRGIAGFSINLCNGLLGGRMNIRVLLLGAYITSVTLALLLLLWQFVPSDRIAAVVAAALAGGSISLNMTQTPGSEFNNKVAVFSFYHFISGIAVAFGYLLNNYMCAQHQIYLYVSVTSLALPTFIILNVILHKNAKKKRNVGLTNGVTQEEKAFVQKLSPDEMLSHRIQKKTQEEFLTASQASLTFA